MTLEMIKGGKKEPCVYCGQDPHPVPLACPRIATLWINEEGYVEGIDFRDDWEEPDVAG